MELSYVDGPSYVHLNKSLTPGRFVITAAGIDIKLLPKAQIQYGWIYNVEVETIMVQDITI